MKPKSFHYRSAGTIEDALAILAEHGSEAKVIAGGQSLVPMMNFRVVAPEVIVDINRIDSLERLSVDGGVLRIGALVRHRRIETDPLVAIHAPLLRKAVHHVAHLAIRNSGTFGGSICHADPAAEFPACTVLLQATMEIASTRGVREVPAEAFFKSPFLTAVEADELLVAVRIPLAAPDTAVAFHEVSRRQGDFALSGVAASATADGATRWVAFGVGGRPIVLAEVARLCREARFAEIDEAAIGAAIAIDLADPDAGAERAALQRVLTAELVRRCLGDFATQAPRRTS